MNLTRPSSKRIGALAAPVSIAHDLIQVSTEIINPFLYYLCLELIYCGVSAMERAMYPNKFKFQNVPDGAVVRPMYSAPDDCLNCTFQPRVNPEVQPFLC
jgi:hypothetical protein